MMGLFPVYVFEKDDCSMFLMEKPEEILYHLEEVDIEGGEYLFWDRSGQAMCVSIKNRAVESIHPCEGSTDLRDAFALHAESIGVEVDMQGDLQTVWERLRAAEVTSDARRGVFASIRKWLRRRF